MNPELQKRKSPRISGFDYTSSRYYFITICTAERRSIFGSVSATADNGEMNLNHTGKIVEEHITRLGERYPTVSVCHYVIMPNHIHMLLLLDNDNTIPLPQIIGLFKSGVSRELGFPVWQRSFHDHVIRNEADYKNICTYIDHNPARWAMDKYYDYNPSVSEGKREGQQRVVRPSPTRKIGGSTTRCTPLPYNREIWRYYYVLRFPCRRL